MFLRFVNSQEVIPVEFKLNDVNHVTVYGNVPENTDGFRLARFQNMKDNWNYTSFTTIYRKLDNGIQFSNDGSKYVPVVPKKNVVISASWDDGNNFDEKRPESIEVVATIAGEEQTVVLAAWNNWSQTIYNVLEEAEVSIATPEVEEYEVEVNGTTINLSTDYVLPTEPTVEERLGDLEMAVCELAGLILGEEAQELEIEEEPEVEEAEEEPVEELEEIEEEVVEEVEE